MPTAVSHPSRHLPRRSVDVRPQVRCSNHRRVDAEWSCPRCQQSYCPSCMVTKISGATEFVLCPSCRSQCESLAPPPPDRNFYAKIPGAFLYPLKGWATVLLIFGGIFFHITALASHFSMRAWLAGLAVMGYLCVYLLKIVSRTALGEDELPNWPSLSEGLVGTFFLFIFTFLLMSLPILGYGAAVIWLDAPLRFLILPIYFTGFLMPMALLRVAMFQSLSALNPIRLIGSIAVAPTPYVWTVVMLFLLVLARSATGVGTMLVPWVGGWLESLVGFYLLIVEVRILGLLYWAYESRYDWFSDIVGDARGTP